MRSVQLAVVQESQHCHSWRAAGTATTAALTNSPAKVTYVFQAPAQAFAANAFHLVQCAFAVCALLLHALG